ncbi:MAG: hypothetical protein IT281_08740 [Ignavibacteria bacterium]|nr:hypothetical protein [Ignavibacteria bacterium]MCC7159611.1 hypothetical protein [Ignavibacteria bacterium]
MDNHKLLENHLQFLSSHRGVRKTLRDIEYIISDKPSFNIAFSLSDSAIESIQ